MNLPLISQQCEYFKIEYGVLGASWTEWSFITFYNEESVLILLKSLKAGLFVKVYGYDILNGDWIKLVHKPILRRVK